MNGQLSIFKIDLSGLAVYSHFKIFGAAGEFKIQSVGAAFFNRYFINGAQPFFQRFQLNAQIMVGFAFNPNTNRSAQDNH